MNNRIPDNIIIEILMSKVLYEYESYDHRNAVKDMVSTGIIPAHQIRSFGSYTLIPDVVKQKHQVLRIGKIRSIEFRPNGDIFRYRIGNKRAKTFYPHDFVITVKPILYKFKDKYDLINNGLAVENKLIT